MLNVKDMEELIHIHDACDTLNTTLMGTEIALCYNEGLLGAFSRIHAVIERNVTEKLKEDDYKGVWEIMDNKSLTPDKRAKLLVGDEDGIGCE